VNHAGFVEVALCKLRGDILQVLANEAHLFGVVGIRNDLLHTTFGCFFEDVRGGVEVKRHYFSASKGNLSLALRHVLLAQVSPNHACPAYVCLGHLRVVARGAAG